MKGRIHLFEHNKHDNVESLFIKTNTKNGQILSFRHNYNNTNDIPCDLLVVYKPNKYNINDLFLVHDKLTETYYIDKLTKHVDLSDIDSDVANVFIGEKGTVTSVDNVEKIIASTFVNEEFEDELMNISDLNPDFTFEYQHKYNIGKPIFNVDIKVNGKEEINKIITDSGYNYFELSKDDIHQLIDMVEKYKEMPILDDENDIILTDITEDINYISNSPVSNENKIQVGNVIVEVGKNGVSMILADPTKFYSTTIDMTQLSSIVGFILNKVTRNR